MRLTLVVATVAAVILIFTTRGFPSASVAAAPEESAWGNAVNGVRLALTLSARSVKVGTPITYAVYLWNSGRTSASYTSCFFAGEVVVGLEIRDATGATVVQTNRRPTYGFDCSRNVGVTLGPGAVDLVATGSISEFWSLPPGRYTLGDSAPALDSSNRRLNAQADFTITP